MINLKKFQSIHIVTLSSLSTQLGFLTAQKKFANEKCQKNQRMKDLYIILMFPSTSDKEISNVAKLKEFFYLHNKDESKILLIKIKQIWKRILISPFLYFLKIFFSNPIFLWQTRYKWLEDSLEFKPRKLFDLRIKVNIPDLKIILFGDGFLNLMPVNIPFWLANQKINFSPQSKIFKSYHLFSLGINLKEFNSYELNPYEVRKFLKLYLEKDNRQELWTYLYHLQESIKIGEKEKKIYIFPTTTFFETKRSNLKEEINLYIDFLKESKLKTCNYLIIKPHPGSSKIKNFEFYKKLKSDPFFKDITILNPQESQYYFSLSNLPLELIITYVYYFTNLNIENSIILCCCSTASLSAKTLFPFVKIEKAFGKKFIEKYLQNDFQKQRILQEELLANVIDEKFDNVK